MDPLFYRVSDVCEFLVVGIARPLTAEPFLVKDILRGTKLGAKSDKFPPIQLLRVSHLILHFSVMAQTVYRLLHMRPKSLR